MALIRWCHGLIYHYGLCNSQSLKSDLDGLDLLAQFSYWKSKLFGRSKVCWAEGVSELRVPFLMKLRDSAQLPIAQELSSFIFPRLFVCKVSVTSHFMSTYWWFGPCKPYMFWKLMTPTIQHSLTTHWSHTWPTKNALQLKVVAVWMRSDWDLIRDSIWDPIRGPVRDPIRHVWSVVWICWAQCF